MPGYSGVNCTSLCPYPQYGVDCQQECNCSKEMCNVSTGCNSPSTGNIYEKKYLESKAAVNENVVVSICNSMYIIWYFYYNVYNCSAIFFTYILSIRS